MNKPLVIIGASGHARVILDIIRKQALYHAVGFLDDRDTANGCEDCPVLGRVEAIAKLYAQGVRQAIVGIGDNFQRMQLVERIKKLCPQIEFARAIHPSAVVAGNVTIGPGSVVMAGSVIDTCSTVGCHCIVNSCANLGHDSTMDDYASLAPRSTTGGNCKIEACSAIGIGATLIHGVSVGEHSVVGAGATVLKDIGPYSIAYGIPARVIRSREAGERYLS